MVEIEYDKIFLKHFKIRISSSKKLVTRYQERFNLFIKDRTNRVLQDHKLAGKFKDKRAFSITGDIRVIYSELDKGHYELLDIGTHPQIYGM